MKTYPARHNRLGKPLSRRELELARIFYLNAPRQAALLNISVHTARDHRRSICQKLNLAVLADIVYLLDSHPQLKELKIVSPFHPPPAPQNLADIRCSHCGQPIGHLYLQPLEPHPPAGTQHSALSNQPSADSQQPIADSQQPIADSRKPTANPQPPTCQRSNVLTC